MAYDQETVRTLYKKLLSLYPRAFREQMGESMEQTFNDLCNERKRQTKRGLFGFVLWLFIETSAGIVKENLTEIKRGKIMESIVSNNKSSAIIRLSFSNALDTPAFDRDVRHCAVERFLSNNNDGTGQSTAECFWKDYYHRRTFALTARLYCQPRACYAKRAGR